MSNKSLAIILANFKSKWNPGINVCTSHNSHDERRMYLLNSSTGDIQSRGIRWTKRIIDTPDWRTNFGVNTDSILSYDIGGKTYLMHGNSSTGVVNVLPVDLNGALGDPVYETKWTSGWDNFQTYSLNGKLFMVIIKSRMGNIDIHKINSDGKIGSRQYNGNIGSNWELARTFQINTKAFLFILNPRNGNVEIHELNNSGEIEKFVAKHDWSSGWNVANFYTAGSQVFLFLLKSSTGEVHIQKMNSDGTVGDRTFTTQWSIGWDSATFYSVNGVTCLSLIKSSNGQGHLHEMGADGKVGLRINPKEPFTKEYFEEQLTEEGTGKGLLYDYFEDISRGRVNLESSFVTEWLTIQDSWENVKENLGRGGKVDVARELAIQIGYTFDDSQTVIAIHSQPGGAGATGTDVLTHPHSLTLEFIAHEVLHTWGLGHSFSDDRSIKQQWGNRLAWAEYDNPWDIMSANNSSGYDNGLNKSVGPGLNIFGLEQMDWVSGSKIINIDSKDTSRDITINSLSIRTNRSNLGIKVHQELGEYYGVEFRTKDEWDKGIPSPTALIHRIEASATPANVTWGGDLGKGWDVLHVFRVNQKSFLIRLKSASGEAKIKTINENGEIKSTVYSSNWTSGWTNIETYTILGTTYMFILKEDLGNAHIYKMNSDGTFGTKIYDSTWAKGWSSARTFTVGDKTFFFVLSKDYGTVAIQVLDNNGAFREEVAQYQWSKGWSKVQFYYQNGDCFALFYKESTGEVDTHKMNSDGSVGKIIASTSYGTDWDTIGAYGKVSTQLIWCNSLTGEVHFQSTNANGSLEKVIKEAKRKWNKGWTEVIGFGTSKALYMFSYKKTGRAEISMMSKARVLRKRKNVDKDRSPVTSVYENGVSIEVKGMDLVNKTATIRIG